MKHFMILVSNYLSRSSKVITGLIKSPYAIVFILVVILIMNLSGTILDVGPTATYGQKGT